MSITDGEREVLAELGAEGDALIDECEICGEAICPECWRCTGCAPDQGGCGCEGGAYDLAMQAELDRERDAILQMEREQAELDAKAAAREAELVAGWCLGHMVERGADGVCPDCAAETARLDALEGEPDESLALSDADRASAGLPTLEEELTWIDALLADVEECTINCPGCSYCIPLERAEEPTLTDMPTLFDALTDPTA